MNISSEVTSISADIEFHHLSFSSGKRSAIQENPDSNSHSHSKESFFYMAMAFFKKNPRKSLDTMRCQWQRAPRYNLSCFSTSSFLPNITPEPNYDQHHLIVRDTQKYQRILIAESLNAHQYFYKISTPKTDKNCVHPIHQ